MKRYTIVLSPQATIGDVLHFLYCHTESDIVDIIENGIQYMEGRWKQVVFVKCTEEFVTLVTLKFGVKIIPDVETIS